MFIVFNLLRILNYLLNIPLIDVLLTSGGDKGIDKGSDSPKKK